MKKIFKNLVLKVLWWQVDKLRQKYPSLKVIGVAGSVGKTTTKYATAKVLSKKYKTVWQEGNYNDVVSLPLVFFNQDMPSLLNPFAWLSVFIKNQQLIKSYPYEVVVLELGTDHRGDMAQLEGKIKLDYLLLTAITPEHMQGFTDLDDVAQEELLTAKFADHVLIDGDSVPAKYQTDLDNPGVVSFNEGDVVIFNSNVNEYGQSVSFKTPDHKFSFKTKFIAKHNLPALALAYLTALILDVNEANIKAALEDLDPFPGRMVVLKGLSGSIIIDDTYNSSPEAAIAALDTLYNLKAKHKIAILGQMNEMGDFSQGYHEEVGQYCDPKQLDLVATIGKDANQYLAKEAEAKGCKVLKFETPYHAGEIIAPMLKKDTIVLVKGSQNGVFAEETVKLLLENPEDQEKLVRQDHRWPKFKAQHFKGRL